MGSRSRTSSSERSTERVHPRAEDLDLRSTAQIVRRLHQEELAAVRALSRSLPAIARVADAALAALKAGGRLLYAGAGTSGRLGLLDAAECPPTFGSHPRQVQALLAGGSCALLEAVEGAEDDGPSGARAVRDLGVSSKDLLVGISASGRTPFVLGALTEAKRRKARTALISAAPTARRKANLFILLPTGPELVAGSTRLKAGTATKLALNAISTAAFVRLGKVYRGRMVELKVTNAKLAQRAQRTVQELGGVTAVQARRLLTAAGGQPKLALAMLFTGKDAREARRAVDTYGLRLLEKARPPGGSRR